MNIRQTELLEEVIKVLEPFAEMHREGSDLKEVACQRGHASDLTIIDSQNFKDAKKLLEKLKSKIMVKEISRPCECFFQLKDYDGYGDGCEFSEIKCYDHDWNNPEDFPKDCPLRKGEIAVTKKKD